MKAAVSIGPVESVVSALNGRGGRIGGNKGCVVFLKDRFDDHAIACGAENRVIHRIKYKAAAVQRADFRVTPECQGTKCIAVRPYNGFVFFAGGKKGKAKGKAEGGRKVIFVYWHN